MVTALSMNSPSSGVFVSWLVVVYDVTPIHFNKDTPRILWLSGCVRVASESRPVVASETICLYNILHCQTTNTSISFINYESKRIVQDFIL